MPPLYSNSRYGSLKKRLSSRRFGRSSSTSGSGRGAGSDGGSGSSPRERGANKSGVSGALRFLRTTARDRLSAVLAFLKSLFSPKAPEPSYPVLPAADEKGESSVPGVYLVGEVAGTPLIKLGLNAGHALVDRLAPELRGEQGGDAWDFVIVGAGAAGLAAAARAQSLGLRAVVVDANHAVETVYTMTKGKILFAEPETIPNESLMWFEECTKEQLLQKWSQQIRELGLDVREFEKVVDVKRKGRLLEVITQKQKYLARRVILAVGKAGNPRKAGVKGELEHGAKIAHRLLDPADFAGRKLLVYGGGDVALEATLALADTNEVTLVTIDEQLTYPKKRNVDALRAKEAAGRVKVHLGTQLAEIGERSVTFARNGEQSTIDNDFVFEMIGAELPTPFFRKIGVKLENEWHLKRWIALLVAFLLVYALYGLKSYGKGVSAWPFEDLISVSTYDRWLLAIYRAAFLPFAWLFDARAQADLLSDRGYQQGYLYSLLYTIVMLGFGFEALVRWRGIAKNKQYQTWRYASLLAFQVL